MFLVSHSLGVVRMTCNRAIWLEKGQIVMDGEANEVVDAYEAMYDPEQEAQERKRLRAKKRQERKAAEEAALQGGRGGPCPARGRSSSRRRADWIRRAAGARRGQPMEAAPGGRGTGERRRPRPPSRGTRGRPRGGTRAHRAGGPEELPREVAPAEETPTDAAPGHRRRAARLTVLVTRIAPTPSGFLHVGNAREHGAHALAGAHARRPAPAAHRRLRHRAGASGVPRGRLPHPGLAGHRHRRRPVGAGGLPLVVVDVHPHRLVPPGTRPADGRGARLRLRVPVLAARPRRLRPMRGRLPGGGPRTGARTHRPADVGPRRPRP